MIEKATEAANTIKTLTLRQSIRLLVALVVLMPIFGVWLHNKAIDALEKGRCDYYIKALQDSRNSANIVSEQRNDLLDKVDTLQSKLQRETDARKDCERDNYILTLQNDNLADFKIKTRTQQANELKPKN